MTMSVLRVRNVGWRPPAGPDVLHGVSLDVDAKEFVAIMGRNGAGKSTLLDVIAGLRQPTEGSATLAGRSLDEWHPTERARVLAHLPQMLRADLSMRAESLVLMGRYPHATGWLESDDDVRIAAEAMQRCECLAFRHRVVPTLRAASGNACISPPVSRSRRRSCCSTNRPRSSTSISSCNASASCGPRPIAERRAWP